MTAVTAPVLEVAPVKKRVGRPPKAPPPPNQYGPGEWEALARQALANLGPHSGSVHRIIKSVPRYLAGDTLTDPIGRYLYNLLDERVTVGTHHAILNSRVRVKLPLPVRCFLEWYYHEGQEF